MSTVLRFAEEVARVLRETLGEEHPDRDAVAGGRIVVAGRVSHEEHATVGDRAHSLMKVRCAERILRPVPRRGAPEHLRRAAPA